MRCIGEGNKKECMRFTTLRVGLVNSSRQQIMSAEVNRQETQKFRTSNIENLLLRGGS